MKTMSYSESRANYADVLKSVVEDREEVIITRKGHDSAVIVSLDDYNSLRETAYLMRSPRNARRLFDAVDRLEAGEGTVQPLLEAE
ncbi:type II toxin-antitoxin system prevent-host-death family antitoxin [Arcanobacterium phocisimile]|uniref:Antitoxin n=1 Tax=Arcanobacterium phocisimile TaxID=1302235 RepID=A0ABX7IFM7_9ACTO|nr:type II toxin-antitoxin system prevent-host-death family antitoxin [Arcanobacterium phocisimile]QRV01941.1 type II toxin-antitoxin system prevent-host-death family antitoxin [Arcanobacterium phocisimile]